MAVPRWQQVATASLPLVVVADDVAVVGVTTRFVRTGQSLELLGFAELAVEQPRHRKRLRRIVPGHHQLDMPADGSGVTLRSGAVTLEVFSTRALRPGDTTLGDYQIGTYPPVGQRGSAYQAPTQLITVRSESQSQRLSNHFQVGQFLCKQNAGWPRYVTVTPSLLAKLETLVALLQARGLPVQTLTVMSGYRTPSYNRALGNVAYSRHIYGDAADVFVDMDQDGQMDDLNGDGVSDVADAVWLLQLLEQHEQGSERAESVTPGGLGAYPANAYHGPFLHIDARGSRARWGHQPN